MTTIALEPITIDYLPKREGIYLVKAVSTGSHPLKKPRFLEARVTLTKERERQFYAIDISNQVALEISTEPIR